ncbi:MAG TPA: ABC transporter ATP-binding protein, partial [Ktedonobacteraceae bacterium]|nr:ABC transporter ATP-binding protein [Ktedonobacteraceae bacterium]
MRLDYSARENEGLDYNNIVLNEAAAVLPEDTARVREVLGRFLFNGDRVFQEVGTLSGGEKTRLALAKMVLGEPTSHLDVLSRNIIGEALGSYRGTTLAVTHDIEFVKYMKYNIIM